MNDLDLSKLMQEIGPLIQAEEVREFSNHEWGIALPGEFIIFLEADETNQKLFFVSELGKIESKNPTEVYRWMLGIASIWHETGGTRLALHPTEETVEFIYDTTLPGLTLEKLKNQLLNFYGAALEMRQMIQQPFEDAQPASNETLENFVRV